MAGVGRFRGWLGAGKPCLYNQWRSFGGVFRRDHLFHPSIGAATHARWALENTVRFTRNKSTTVRTGEAPKEIQMNSPEPFGDAPALGQDSKRRLRRLIEAGIRRVGHLVGSFCRDEDLGRR